MTKRLTVADIRAMKGRHQFTMVRTDDWETLEAAERAGVEMVSVTPEMMVDPRFREVAPTVFAVPGVNFYELGTPDDFTRWAFRWSRRSADAVYVSAGLPTMRRLAEDNIPVISHVGTHPVAERHGRAGSRRSARRPRARCGLPGDEGPRGGRRVRAEIEVVPADMTAEISKRTSLFMVSMGAGTGGDCQYLFARTCWARTGATSRGTRRSTATSPPSTTGSRPSGSPRSRSSSPTCGPGRTRRTGTSSASIRPSCDRFLADLEAAGG